VNPAVRQTGAAQCGILPYGMILENRSVDSRTSDFAPCKINGLAGDWRQSIPDRSEVDIPLIQAGAFLRGM
jgi:hypothetical protein